jgi:mismatch-specific thymine-DNA glycosylase
MRTLPDYLRKGMKMILIGSNPGDRAARVGHYYAGRGNQFWPIMYESGVIPEPLSYEDDRRILEFGIGMTDLVKRPTRTPEEIERQEFAEGRVLLAQKLEENRPHFLQAGPAERKTLRGQRVCAAFHRRAERRQRARRKKTLLQETWAAVEES